MLRSAFFHQSDVIVMQPPTWGKLVQIDKTTIIDPASIKFSYQSCQQDQIRQSDTSCTMSTALSSSLAEAELVPGVAASLIPENFKPTIDLRVSFDGKAVELGNLLRASDCKRSPSIQFNQEVRALV